MSELEEIVRRDPAMTLQLLQLASVGAGKGMRRTVRTFREALVIVGWRRLQSWVCLLLIGGKGQASQEEMTSALTRARMCELLAQSSDPSLSESAFIAGMLSSFDALLDMPLEEVLRDLPLDPGLRGRAARRGRPARAHRRRCRGLPPGSTAPGRPERARGRRGVDGRHRGAHVVGGDDVRAVGPRLRPPPRSGPGPEPCP